MQRLWILLAVISSVLSEVIYFDDLFHGNTDYAIKEDQSFKLYSHSEFNNNGYPKKKRNYTLSIATRIGFLFELKVETLDLGTCNDFIRISVFNAETKCCLREICAVKENLSNSYVITWFSQGHDSEGDLRNYNKRFILQFISNLDESLASNTSRPRRELNNPTLTSGLLGPSSTVPTENVGGSNSIPPVMTQTPHSPTTTKATSTIVTTPTTKIHMRTTSPPTPNSEVYLWLPLIVVVIFTGILVTLIMVGRRGNENPFADIISGENNRLRLEMNANQVYQQTDGNPETPPPTYDVIARQTSYVSQISQNSDQVQVPPEYDEAIGWQQTTQNNRQNNRNRAVRWRNGSQSVGRSSSQRMNWSRLFSRSHSVSTRERSSSNAPTDSSIISTVFNESIISPEGTPRLSRSASQPSISTPIGSLQTVAMENQQTEAEGDENVFIETITNRSQTPPPNMFFL